MDSILDSWEEKWEWIEGFIGRYKVSTKGRILSTVGHTPKLLVPITHESGHIKINLVAWTREVKTCLISRLVLATFDGGDRSGTNVIHINDDITDNRLVNLRWTDKGDGF